MKYIVNAIITNLDYFPDIFHERDGWITTVRGKEKPTQSYYTDDDINAAHHFMNENFDRAPSSRWFYLVEESPSK